MMKPITAIIFKDIVIELRSKESISSMLMQSVRLQDLSRCLR